MCYRSLTHILYPLIVFPIEGPLRVECCNVLYHGGLGIHPGLLSLRVNQDGRGRPTDFTARAKTTFGSGGRDL